jgi:small subunit ribosomal protein S21
MQVFVRDNNVDQALKVLKKKMQREGFFREMKRRGHYEKTLREKGPREGGGRPPCPQARAQEAAARGSTAAEASSKARSGTSWPPAHPSLLSRDGCYVIPLIRLTCRVSCGLSVDYGIHGKHNQSDVTKRKDPGKGFRDPS